MIKENKKITTIPVKKAANILRGSMDTSEYKGILLPLVFYKYLSDKQLTQVNEITENPSNNLKESQNAFEILCKVDESKKIILKRLKESLGYSIHPEFTFTTHVKAIEENKFQAENLSLSLKHVEEYNPIFRGIFSDENWFTRKIGHTSESNDKLLSEIIYILSSLGNMNDYSQKELGDFFEELVAFVASVTGKKSGEFFSPPSTNKLMAKLTLQGSEKQSEISAYDPTMGSGSLLLSVQKYSKSLQDITFYGQEINISTLNLARMNMFFHGVPIEKQHLYSGDSLAGNWPDEGHTKFDTVLMNPPYSLRWGAEDTYINDPRFKDYGALAPKSKADYAFLLHGYHHLKENGTMVILLPHGVLFRGGSEGKIRQTLLEIGAIDCVIGLPGNLMYGTTIPTVAIVLKKNRSNKDVLFIDASQEFEKDGFQVTLTDKHINKIIETYKNRKSKNKYAYVAPLKEIEKNDYNLNIPRYINTFEEKEVSLDELSDSIKDTQQELNQVEKELLSVLQNLKLGNQKNNKNLTDFIEHFINSNNKG